MLKTETSEVSCWYDYELLRDIKVSCECGQTINEEQLFTEGSYQCSCGEIVKLADLDALADALESPIPHS
jgi:hypothetical protein